MSALTIVVVVLVVLVLGGLALSVRIVQQYEKGVPSARSWTRPPRTGAWS
jgi:hypothetical protein